MGCSPVVFLWVGPSWKAHLGSEERPRGGCRPPQRLPGLRLDAAGTPAPPPLQDVVISLHPQGLARPRPLPPYKAALPPRDVGMSSHPFHRCGAEAPQAQWLAPGRRLVRKKGRNFTAIQHCLVQRPTPSTPTSHTRKRRLAQTQRVRENQIQLGFCYLSIHSSQSAEHPLCVRHRARRWGIQWCQRESQAPCLHAGRRIKMKIQ